MYKVRIYQKENIGDESSELTFATRESLVKYLQEQAEDAFHVGNDYMLVHGGWTKITVSGGIFQYLDPELWS